MGGGGGGVARGMWGAKGMTRGRMVQALVYARLCPFFCDLTGRDGRLVYVSESAKRMAPCACDPSQLHNSLKTTVSDTCHMCPSVEPTGVDGRLKS